MNIIVAGAQNSGKTTKLSSLCADAARIRPDARLIVVQDRDELAISHRDHLKLFWKVAQKRYDHSGGAVVYSYESADLLEDVVRTNADFYVFGELRDPMAAVGLLYGQQYRRPGHYDHDSLAQRPGHAASP